MAIVFALLAALSFAVGFVVQQRTAATAPDDVAMSPKLIVYLVRQPAWLAGIVATIIGSGLQAAALYNGPLTIVAPAMTMNIVFALWLSALWERQHLSGRDWLGAVGVMAGLGLFVFALSPAEGRADMPTFAWIAAMSSVATLVVICIAAAWRYPGVPRAALLAIATGAILGLQDTLNRASTHRLAEGFDVFLTHWQPYALGITGALAFSIVQGAYKAAPLPASLPWLLIMQPLVGTLIGIMGFGEQVRTGTVFLILEAAAIVMAVAGAVTLTRSPLVVTAEALPPYDDVQGAERADADGGGA